MSDLDWCTYCDKTITTLTNSLYCSEACLKADALGHHPWLGYDWQELKDFPRPSSPASCPGLSSTTTSPSLSFLPSPTSDALDAHLSKSAHRPTFAHLLSPPALELEPHKSSDFDHAFDRPTKVSANPQQQRHVVIPTIPRPSGGSIFFI